RQDNTVKVESYDQFKETLKGRNVFIEAYWDGNDEEEGRVKADTKATVRVLPFDKEEEEGKCMMSGRPTRQKAIFARAY
ncbi:MAG TPA: proline--tRNA ligase, partial [Candidatus Melainabacteria bacterium]|nr:proline--tRNA ligase [Candidatus Melainabacteria bacterium]